jgi:hypothetical protein
MLQRITQFVNTTSYPVQSETKIIAQATGTPNSAPRAFKPTSDTTTNANNNTNQSNSTTTNSGLTDQTLINLFGPKSN